MIAIGGAIGTGLFVGSASRLHSTGPALQGRPRPAFGVEVTCENTPR